MPEVSEQDVVQMMKLFSEVKEIIDTRPNDFDLVDFSSGFSKGYGAYSPDLANAAMKNINLNPLQATADKVESALNAAKDNEDLLISYGQDMYLKNMLYKRNFDYINSLPAWNLSIRCINAKKTDYTTEAFKKDYRKVKDFLTKFDYRTEFDKIFFNMLNAETYFGIFRTDMDSEKYIFQDFPYKYTRIPGRSTHSLLYDIDMTYFLQPSIDIDLYPKWIIQRYNKLMSGKSSGTYIPSNEINKRTGQFAMWVQTSPINGFWAFKFKNDIIANIPYFSPMLSDLVLIPVFRKLQLSQSISSARKIIASAWPLLKDQKSANVSDMLAVKPGTMGTLMGAFAKGLEESFKIINLPSEDIQKFEFENTDKTAYSDFLKITSSLMGGGNVLFSTTKNTAVETNLSLNIDEMLATSIYPQFESFVDFQLRQLTKNFKFKIKFSGTKTYLNKEFNKKEAFEAAAVGVVSFNKIANCLGLDIFELEDELDMTNGLGFSEKLMPMLNMFTQSKEDGQAGRKKKTESELSENGIATRDAGSNIGRGGNI